MGWPRRKNGRKEGKQEEGGEGRREIGKSRRKISRRRREGERSQVGAR